LLNRVIEAVSMVTHIKRVNGWRDQFNPLRGLTIGRAVSLLESGERGEYADLQWLYRLVEKRDATLKGLIERYEGGLLKLDWEIKTVDEENLPPGATMEQAEAQAEALRGLYDGIDNLRQALGFLVLADFRGYAHLEKHMTNDGDVIHLEPVPQWYWVRDGINGDWQYNAEARAGTKRGEEVPLEKFIIRECPRPVNEIALINFVFGNLALKDWAAFVETYGIPAMFVVGPPNVPAGKEPEYQSVAEQIIANARGYLPNGSDIKSVDAGERGVNPFKEFRTELKELVVLAGTGGKLTMLTESGSGTLAGGAHQDAWDDIVQGKSRELSEVLQRQIDQSFLEKNFPEQGRLARFELQPEEDDATTKEFYRKVWLGFLQDGTVNDVLANMTNLRSLTQKVNVPIQPKYEEPWLPVKDDKGQLVTGDTTTDAEGDIVGGQSAEDRLDLSGKETEVGLPEFKLMAEAYGVGVRAGVITPNEDDENFFRKLAKLPPIPPEVRRSWREQQTRQPITLQQESEGGGGLPPGAGALPQRPQPGQLRNRGQETLEAAAREALGKALANDLAPVRQRLAAILAIEDEEILRNRLSAFLAELPQLLKDMGADPESAQVLEAAMGASMINGMGQPLGGRK